MDTIPTPQTQTGKCIDCGLRVGMKLFNIVEKLQPLTDAPLSLRF